MGALGGSWYLNKGGPGGYYSSEPCRDITAKDLLNDAKELDKLVKELNKTRRSNTKDCPR